jgi:hypothetical protein
MVAAERDLPRGSSRCHKTMVAVGIKAAAAAAALLLAEHGPKQLRS